MRSRQLVVERQSVVPQHRNAVVLWHVRLRTQRAAQHDALPESRLRAQHSRARRADASDLRRLHVSRRHSAGQLQWQVNQQSPFIFLVCSVFVQFCAGARSCRGDMSVIRTDGSVVELVSSNTNDQAATQFAIVDTDGTGKNTLIFFKSSPGSFSSNQRAFQITTCESRRRVLRII